MTFTTQLVALMGPVLAADEQTTTSALSGAMFGSFVAAAAVAVALFFLGFDLVRRLRRAKYRDEIAKELAAEIAERDAAEGRGDAGRATGDDGQPPSGGSVSGEADPRTEDDAPKA